MVFDGLANKASFMGTEDERVRGAIVHSPASASEFEADQLDLYLQQTKGKKPPAQPPNDNEEAKGLPSTQTFFKPMSGRSLQKMVLTGNADIRSIEPAGALPEDRLRAVRLTSNQLTYLAGTNDNGHFHGEGPGTLLLEDYRPTDKVVSDEEPTSSPLATAPKPRRSMQFQRVGPGKTAFKWTDSADYYQDKRTVILLGDVRMVSLGYAMTLPAKPADRVNAPNRRDLTLLWAQKLTVTLAESNSDKTAQKGPGFGDISAMDELQIESIEATGDATLISGDVDIRGQKIAHSTKTNEILIKGSRKHKAVLTYFDPEKGWGTWQGPTIRYNTLTRRVDAPGGKFRAHAR